MAVSEAEKKETPKETEKPAASKEAAAEAPKEPEKPADGKEAAAEEPEKPAEPEKPKELEEDSKADKRAKLAADSVAFNEADATLNVMPSMGGKILMTLADEHFSSLLACSRANVGVLSGRYMFEVKILENKMGPQQKHYVRIGLSLAGSSLFLSDTEDSVSFDSEGSFVAKPKRTKPGSCRFHKGMIVAVLLNRDAASPNAETVSLFINGIRACEPQKLPEAFQGKALYPTINYKGVTMQVNFGSEPLHALPFSCHMLSGAAKKDVEMSKVTEPAQGELLFPVGLPDQGVYDWVDDFLQKNPSYIELSSRGVEEWAQKSGVGKGEGLSLSKFMKSVAPVLKKKYVYMDLKSNLIAKDRDMALKGFPGFKKSAAVLMGEPSAEYKQTVKSLILEGKTKLAEAELKKKKAEVARKRAADERIKKAEAAKKARMDAAKKKTDEKAEEKTEEAPEEAAEEKPAEEEDIKMEPVELTEEESKLWYRPKTGSELPEQSLAKVFTSFSLPEKAEGFDDITFPWQPANTSQKHLTDYILQRKLTCRVEDLHPGEWFKEQSKKFQAWFTTLKKRQNDWKNPAQKKAIIAKIIADKKKAEKTEDGEEKKEEGEKKEEEPAVELPKIDADDLNPLEVEDVMDIGSGEPLFANFAYEDWELLSLRAELLLLVHAFKKDMDDPERTGFHKSHAAFYYNKYFKKQLVEKQYGQNSIADLISLVKDAIVLNSQDVLEAILPEDAPHDGLVKLTEEHRRDRQRRVDAGDETAELKFKKQQPQQQGSWKQQPQQPSWAPAKRPHVGGIPPAKYPRTGYQPIRR